MKLKFAVLAAAVFTAGVLISACTEKTSSSAGSKSLPADFFSGAIGGEISISAYDSMAYRAYLEEAAALFEARYPGTKVKVETFSAMPEVREMDQGTMRAVLLQSQDNPQARADYISRVNTNIMSGTGADLYAMDILPLRKFTESKTLENLEPYMNTDPAFNRADYRQNILSALRYQGGTWFLPMDYSFNYFSYDSTLVPAELAAGFGADKVWNTGELLKPGIPLYTGTYKLFNSMDYVRGNGGMFFQLLNENIQSFVKLETSKANFLDGGFTGLLESVKRYGEDGLIPRGITGQQDAGRIMQRGAEAPTDRFFFKLNGNMSLIGQFSRSLGMRFNMMIQGSAAAIDDDDEIAGIRALADGSVPFSFNQGFGINSRSKNKAAAWAFLKFLLSDEMQLSTGLNAMGLPLNNKAREEKAESLFSGSFMGRASGLPLNDQQRLALENYRSTVEKLSDSINTFVVQDSSVNDMISSEVEYFFGGSRTADEAARVLQNKVDLYLNE